MKTNIFNIVKCVVIAVAVMFTASANAQTLSAADSAHIQDQKEKLAFMVGAMRGSANDVEFSAPEVKNGLVTSVTGVRHPSFKLNIAAGGTMLFSSANDEYGKSNATSATVSAGGEYIFKHKEAAKVALMCRLDVEFNSKVKVENLETSAWGAFASLGFVTTPCNRFQFAAMATAGYINRTSQKYISNDVAEGNVDFNSNPFAFGGTIRASYTIAYTKKVKNYNIKGQTITGISKTPVDLFLSIRGLFNNIDKPKVNGNGSTLSQGSATVMIGLAFGL